MNHPMSVNVNTRVRWSAMQTIPCIKNLHGASVWDAAAGLGFFAEQMSARGARVLATDIDENSLIFCSKIPGVQTCLLNLEVDKLPAGPFDCILVGEVLEHIKNPNEFLIRAAQKLRSGGTLLLTTPAYEGLLTHTAGKRLCHDTGAEKHERDGFTIEELRSFYLNAGLENFNHRYCIYFLAESFMQLTKWFYLRKSKKYSAQSDVLAYTNTFIYKTLRAIYPLLHFIFLAEDLVLQSTSINGHCHIVWATKP